MTEGDGITRRSIFGAVIDSGLSREDNTLSRVMDMVAPDTTKELRKLRQLQEQEGEISSQSVAKAIGGVVRLFPVVYELDQGVSGMNYAYASQTLPLGAIDIKLNHLNWYGFYSGIEEASVLFNPDSYSLDEVTIIFSDDEDCDNGRSDVGAFEDFSPAITMTTDEEDNYIDEMEAQGFYDYDKRVILESVFQAVVFGERSTYWEDVVRPMLRIDELATFNRAWFRELLSNRGIDPDLFEVASRQLPIREGIELAKQGERLSRFDAMRHITRKGTTMLRGILSPREKAIIPQPDQEIEEIVLDQEDRDPPKTIPIFLRN